MHQSISSRSHPLVDACRRLARGEGDAGTVLLDGEHLVTDALRAGVHLRALFVGRDAYAGLARSADAQGADVYEVSPRVMDAASPVRTPSGIVAIAEWRPSSISEVFESSPALAVGLVDVQDPGNVGAVIRSADALEASGVVTLGQTADPRGWKALRGAMGSTFRVPVALGDLAAAVGAARANGVSILATVSDDGVPAADTPLDGPVLILAGNEGAGLPIAATDLADHRVRIPMRAGMNSLNVAVTVSLILYEAAKQRARTRR